MLDLLAFKATDIPIKNDITNGDFSDGKNGWRTQGYQSEFNIVDGVAVTENTTFSSKGLLTRNYINYEIDDVVYFKVNMKVDSLDDINYLRVIFGVSGEDGVANVTDQASEDFVDISDVGKWRTGDCFRIVYAPGENRESQLHLKNALLVNLTKTFGKGNEPTKEQMDILIEQFPNKWFDGTKNLFNAEHFMRLYFKEMREIKNSITTLGGGS